MVTAARIDAARSALVLVDYQQRLLPAIHGGEQAVAQALLLADVALELGLAVIGTEQNPTGLGPNDGRVRQRCARTLAKMHFDACEDGLLEALPMAPNGAPIDVVIAGCEAHVCLMQTALGLRRAGHAVWVCAPACGSRRPEDHALAMQRLAGAGAVIVSTEMVAFEWVHSCRHERFKAVLQRLKTVPG